MGWGVAALVGLAGLLPAQTFNELRNPKGTVFRAFPSADSFRVIVRDVDLPARLAVEQRLPFKVHFNEIGPHAMYVAFRGRKPLGLMYLRREEGKWGITEIGWALTLDLRIVGFHVLRGRSRFGSVLESSGFARGLKGLDYSKLTKLRRSDGRVGSKKIVVPQGAQHLASTVLRSAMKTLLVTDAVWRNELLKLRDLAMGLDAFPSAQRFRRQFVDLGARDDQPRGLRTVHVMRAIGAARSELGVVVRTEVKRADKELTLRWILTPQQRVIRIVPEGPWADAVLLASCNRFEGRTLRGRPDDTALVASVARELATVLEGLGGRGRR